MASPSCAAFAGVVDHITRVHQRSVGLDMGMKTVVYLIRLVNCMSDNNKARSEICTTMVANITDCRMICNQWKWMSTARSCLRTVLEGIQQGTTSRRDMALAIWLFSVLTFFFRTFEQLNGDLGTIQKYWAYSWSRANGSWRYRFFKSLALTCGAIVEMLKIASVSKRLRVTRVNLHASQTGSPTDSSSGKAPVAFPPPGGPESLMNPNAKAEVARLCAQRNEAVMMLFRNLGDMAIYYSWMESYTPNRWVVALAGTYSGAVGLYLVWNSV